MKDTASEMAAVAAELSAQPPAESLPAETGQPDTQPAGTPEGSTTQSAAAVEGQPEAQPAEGQKPRGPLPYERHEAILKNTREQYETQIRELEWAKSMKREEVERMRQLYEWADTDPAGFYEFFGRTLKSDPRYASQFQPAANPTPDPKDVRPEPDVLLEDGRKVYSHEGMDRLLEWQNRQIEKRMNEQFGPLVQEREVEKVMHASRQEAQSILADARTWPGFTQHESKIRELMSQDGRVTLESAYRRVVIPALEAEKNEARTKVRQEVLAELQNKSTASTTNPGAASVNPPKSYAGMTTEQIMREVHAELSGR